MEHLFTRDGAPLTVVGCDVFDRAGHQVARNVNGKMYACDGRYAASVVSDRVVYRPADDCTRISAFPPRRFAPSFLANRRPIALWGVEPFFARDPSAPSRVVVEDPGPVANDEFDDIVARLQADHALIPSLPGRW